MRKGFDEILNICLARVIERGESIEQCLEGYPELTAELQPLLEAALAASGASSATKARPEFERLAKYRFLSALQEKSGKKSESKMPLWRWQRRLAVAFAVILVLFLVGAGTVTASASSLPGDMLYPVKTATEKIQGFFKFGNEAKAGFYIELAQRRLSEIEALSGKNRAISQSLLDTMNEDTEWAIELIIKNKSAGKGLIGRLIGLTSNQKTVLAKVIEKAPPQLKWKLQEALKRSERAHGRAALLEEIFPGMKKFKEVEPVLWRKGGSFLSRGVSNSLIFGDDQDSSDRLIFGGLP
jgi:hypothetical protein